jgi:hypothetical protein
LKHQRCHWQQIPKIGEKSERERNFNIASKTACRGFKSFCPCHRHGSLQTPKIRRLQAFFVPKSTYWTRSIDTGLPWQNPPNAPIFVNIPTATVWYIIKKASISFGEKDGSVPCAEDRDWRRKEMHLFCSTLLCVKKMICLTVVVGYDRMDLVKEATAYERSGKAVSA